MLFSFFLREMQIRLQDTKVRKQIQITTFATFFLPDFRTFGGSLGRSTVAHFARKVRGANIAAAKHELKIQRRYAPERWLYSLRVRGPHFASKVSYNAGAATDDYAGQRPCKVGCSKSRKISARFFAKQQVAKHAHMINEQSAKRSALKGQPVHSPGQHPGYQRINAYAL